MSRPTRGGIFRKIRRGFGSVNAEIEKGKVMADEYQQGQVPAGAAPAGVMPDGTQQIPQFTQQQFTQQPVKKAKKINLKLIFFFLVIIAAVGYYGYQYFLAPTPEFTVNGTKFTMKSTPDDFMKAGLVICDSKGKVVDLTGNSVLPKTVLNTEYQIGLPLSDSYATPTGIFFKVMNTATNAKGVKNCQVYSVTYWPGQDKTGGAVKFNGQDLTDLDPKKWVEAFKAAKYPFSDKELGQFETGGTTLILGERGNYNYKANAETGSGKPSYVQFTNNIKTESKK